MLLSFLPLTLLSYCITSFLIKLTSVTTKEEPDEERRYKDFVEFARQLDPNDIPFMATVRFNDFDINPQLSLKQTEQLIHYQHDYDKSFL